MCSLATLSSTDLSPAQYLRGVYRKPHHEMDFALREKIKEANDLRKTQSERAGFNIEQMHSAAVDRKQHQSLAVIKARNSLAVFYKNKHATSFNAQYEKERQLKLAAQLAAKKAESRKRMLLDMFAESQRKLAEETLVATRR